MCDMVLRPSAEPRSPHSKAHTLGPTLYRDRKLEVVLAFALYLEALLKMSWLLHWALDLGSRYFLIDKRQLRSDSPTR